MGDVPGSKRAACNMAKLGARISPLLRCSLSEWLKERAHDEIWLCGAGTSAFIGDTLSVYLNASPRGPALPRCFDNGPGQQPGELHCRQSEDIGHLLWTQR